MSGFFRLVSTLAIGALCALAGCGSESADTPASVVQPSAAEQASKTHRLNERTRKVAAAVRRCAAHRASPDACAVAQATVHKVDGNGFRDAHFDAEVALGMAKDAGSPDEQVHATVALSEAIDSVNEFREANGLRPLPPLG